MSQTNPSARSLLQRAGKLGLALAATSVLAACVQAPPRYDNRYPQGPAPQQQGSYPQQGGRGGGGGRITGHANPGKRELTGGTIANARVKPWRAAR